MNINSILFDLKEKDATSKRIPRVVFEAEATDEYGPYAFVAGSISYSRSLGGYKLFMDFWYPGVHSCRVSTGHIDDEVRFMKACICLINDVLVHYPGMDAVTLSSITK